MSSKGWAIFQKETGNKIQAGYCHWNRKWPNHRQRRESLMTKSCVYIATAIYPKPIVHRVITIKRGGVQWRTEWCCPVLLSKLNSNKLDDSHPGVAVQHMTSASLLSGAEPLCEPNRRLLGILLACTQTGNFHHGGIIAARGRGWKDLVIYCTPTWREVILFRRHRPMYRFIGADYMQLLVSGFWHLIFYGIFK